MPTRNVHEIMGHLGKDPDLRMVTTGDYVCRLNIATSNSFFDKKTLKWVDKEPDWHNVVVWKELAQKVAQEFLKGDAIMVRGRSRTREYTNNEGQKRYITEVEAYEVYKPVYVPKKSKTTDDENMMFDSQPEAGEIEIPF